jgi:hypothetical protein
MAQSLWKQVGSFSFYFHAKHIHATMPLKCNKFTPSNLDWSGEKKCLLLQSREMKTFSVHTKACSWVLYHSSPTL